ncbi:LolA family protein [Arthrobacter pigmenti]
MKKNLLRWMPAVIAPTAVVAVAVTVPTVAGAAPQLPDKSPQELLAFIAESDETTFSGTIEQTSDLGLPELPSSGSPHGDSDDGAAGAMEMLTESHRAQVHVGGDEQLRVQVMEQMSQRDVIINDDGIWLYDSDAGEAKHLELPEHDGKQGLDKAKGKADGKSHGPAGMPDSRMMQGVKTPAELADKALAKVGPSTDVSVSGTAMIAGRSAYELELTPKTDETLIGSVTLGVDSETGMPLSFAVTARGQTDPAYSVAFTDIDFSTPPDSLFEFTPPDSAKVTEIPAKQHMSKQHGMSGEHHARDGKHHAKGADNGATGHKQGQRPTVIGEGWSSIVSLPAGSAFNGAADSGEGQATLQQLMRPVDGGQVLQTELVSVFITDDGRVLVGAVSAESLMAAAAR